MQRRFRMRKEKIRVNIYLDKELWLKSGYFIENLSAYLNTCLQHAVDKYEMEKDKEERVRIIENSEREEIKKIIAFDWIKERFNEKK